MSHWKKAKLSLKNCSIEVLKKALENIMPEWKKFVRVDPSGQLEMNNSHTGEKMRGFHIVIPHGRNTLGVPGDPNIKYADIGLRREGDGSWSLEVDEAGLPSEVRSFGKTVGQQVQTMKAIAQARARGLQITKNDKVGNQNRIRVIMPVGDQFKIHA